MLNKLKLIKKSPQSIFAWFYLVPLFTLLILFTILPIIQSLQGAFETHPYPNKLTLTKIGLDNFKQVWDDNNFWYAIKNSTLILFIATFISFIIAFLIAYITESLILRFARSTFLTIFYSQFFISSFAVGIAFTFLFGDKNVFFKLINHNEISFRYGTINIVWYYILFQVWRSLPFNIILFSASINRANLKYQKLVKTDNLKTWSKIRYIYFQELKITIFSIMVTNFIFAFLLYPNAILDDDYNFEKNKAHTVTSYILKILGVGDENAFYFDQYKAYAASILVVSYAIILMLFLYLIRIKNLKRYYALIKKIIIKIKGVNNAKNLNKRII